DDERVAGRVHGHLRVRRIERADVQDDRIRPGLRRGVVTRGPHVADGRQTQSLPGIPYRYRVAGGVDGNLRPVAGLVNARSQLRGDLDRRAPLARVRVVDAGPDGGLLPDDDRGAVLVHR